MNAPGSIHLAGAATGVVVGVLAARGLRLALAPAPPSSAAPAERERPAAVPDERRSLEPTPVHSDAGEGREAVEEDEAVDFLSVVRDPARQPVFVHCQHGADRTGMNVAIYRIVEQGWSKEDAITEMTSGGFGYHPIWTELVEYVEALDVEGLRRKLAADR